MGCDAGGSISPAATEPTAQDLAVLAMFSPAPVRAALLPIHGVSAPAEFMIARQRLARVSEAPCDDIFDQNEDESGVLDCARFGRP
jgi:hypothetical protein